MLLSALSSATAGQASTNTPIEHFIYIIQENHSFDNYFGTFPGANGIPAGTRLPEYPNGPLTKAPFLITQSHVPHDLPHTWQAAQTAYDNGAMDGFLWAEWPKRLREYWGTKTVPTPVPGLVHTKGPRNTSRSKTNPVQLSADGEVLSPHGAIDDEDQDAPDVEEQNAALSGSKSAKNAAISSRGRPRWVDYTLGYMDYHVIPNYWDYARTFTLCDEFFSSLMGPSVPNHVYAVAAQSGGLVYNNHVEEEVYSFTTMVDLMENASISWNYYNFGREPQSETIWNPLPGFTQIQSHQDWLTHIVPGQTFYNDLKSGTLPQVCWVVPNFGVSEHPPQDVTKGMWYVTDLINAVMQSSYWNSCAIIWSGMITVDFTITFLHSKPTHMASVPEFPLS